MDAFSFSLLLCLATGCVEAHVGSFLVLSVDVQASESGHHDRTDAHDDGDGEDDDGSASVLGDGVVHHAEPHQRRHEAESGEEEGEVHGKATQQPKLHHRERRREEHHEGGGGGSHLWVHSSLHEERIHDHTTTNT